MRKILSAVLAAAIVLSVHPQARADETPSISARCAVVMNSGGQVVYERSADERMLIASTTKLMTALVVIENCDVDEVVEIQPAWCGIEGSSMYLRPGDRYTVRELLLGLLLASGNDAAVALACHCAGDEGSFAALMNQKAAALGMSNTSYANPHGLDAEGHFSTARDLARLMCCAMDNPLFAELNGLQSAVAGVQTLYNHNKLLARYPGCIGGKTGFTKAAGRCLVTCAEREGTRFVCVTLSDPDDWNDHTKLYNWAFAHYANRLVADESLAFEVPVLSGDRDSVTISPRESCTLFLPLDAEIILNAEMPFYAFAPIGQGAVAGRILVRVGEETVAELPLYYTEGVALKETVT